MGNGNDCMRPRRHVQGGGVHVLPDQRGYRDVQHQREEKHNTDQAAHVSHVKGA